MLGRARKSARFEARVVWMFGSPRSGSTWLWKMLSELENVVAVNEPMIGYYLGPFVCDQPGVRASELNLDTFTVRRIQADRPAQFFAQSYRDVWRPCLRELLNARFRAHAQRTKPHLSLREVTVVLKEPNGSQSADVIMDAQPSARLLFLLRDGRDVVDSQVAGGEEGAWASARLPGVVGVKAEDRLEFAETHAYKWLWQTEVVQEAYRRHEGPKFLLRYEDLVAEPERCLTELIAWLGLRPTQEQISSIVERNSFDAIPEDQRGSDKFFRAATPGLWRENLTPDERERIEAILGAKLRELGYEP